MCNPVGNPLTGKNISRIVSSFLDVASKPAEAAATCLRRQGGPLRPVSGLLQAPRQIAADTVRLMSLLAIEKI